MKNSFVKVLLLTSTVLVGLSAVMYLYPKDTTSIVNQDTSSVAFPQNTLRFESSNYKIRTGETVPLKIEGGMSRNLVFNTSDSSKVKILSTNNEGVIVQKVTDFEDEVIITVYDRDFVDLSSTCTITCFNEIVWCNDIFLYMYYEDPLTGHTYDASRDTVQGLSSGYYVIEFNTDRIRFYDPYEEESIREIKNELESFFVASMEQIKKPEEGDLGFMFFVSEKLFFGTETKRTMYFKIDQAEFLLSIPRIH